MSTTLRGSRLSYLREPEVLGPAVTWALSLMVAGFLSNALTGSGASVVGWIWWFWLALTGVLAYRVARHMRCPYGLTIGPSGLEIRRGAARAMCRWEELSAVLVADGVLYARPADGTRAAAGLARAPGRPPYREVTTGWLVLCPIADLRTPPATLEALLSEHAAPLLRPTR